MTSPKVIIFSNEENSQRLKKYSKLRSLFPSHFFEKGKLLNLKKSFENEAILQFSFLGLLSAQPVCLFCFASLSPIMQFLNQTSTCLDLRHAKKAELEISNEIPFAAVPPTKKIFLSYFWGHRVQCWEILKIEFLQVLLKYHKNETTYRPKINIPSR